MAKRRYSDEERAAALAALAANRGDISLTAKQVGVPADTLRSWAKGTRHPEAGQMSEHKKGDLAEALERIAWGIVEVIPGKISDAPLGQLMVALGITVEKMQLLRGKATAITAEQNRGRAVANAVLFDPVAREHARQLTARLGERNRPGNGGHVAVGVSGDGAGANSGPATPAGGE